MNPYDSVSVDLVADSLGRRGSGDNHFYRLASYTSLIVGHTDKFAGFVEANVLQGNQSILYFLTDRTAVHLPVDRWKGVSSSDVT
jgi:hypothetical protein